ncbi:MAG: hypothetical protein GKR91_18825 [Pseudomonadales bacterium]|nr:hypothetical protein [Pseudomonadales bacterium]
MYSQLVKTEFEGNRFVLFVSIVLNIFFFILFSIEDSPDDNPVGSFMGATSIVFYVCLIVLAIQGSDEKRYQLYTLLPVTATESFLAGWFWVLCWLGLQVCFWLLFAFTIDPSFESRSVIEIASTGLSFWFLIVLIANAIDLGSFRPAYVQWAYIGGIVILIGVLARLGISIGIYFGDEENDFFPFGLFADPTANIFFVCTLVVLLMIANWYIFTRSDHYLR